MHGQTTDVTIAVHPNWPISLRWSLLAGYAIVLTIVSLLPSEGVAEPQPA